jgi:ADP-ribosylglycohydrolase
MNLNISPRFSDKAYAGIWGFIVGDAFGVPYEFKSRVTMSLFPATDMSGWGTYDQPPGTWSDDTSMMLCVLENLHANGNTEDLANLFVRWAYEAYHTPHGEVFDIGITTSTALHRYKHGIKESGLDDDHSAGNGSLMRCLPYSFFDRFDSGTFILIKDGMITHKHWSCSTSCHFYTRMIRALAEGESKSDALHTAAEYIHRWGWRLSEKSGDDIEHSLFKRLQKEGFAQIPEDEIRSSGYVIDSLEASVWSFMNATDYRSTVLKAVNLGGDTDTIAGLAGGLAAIHYGISDIPAAWLEVIVGRDELDKKIRKWVGLDV